MNPNTVIVTVGTSLLTNLRGLERKDNRSEIESELLRFVKQGEWGQIARKLQSFEPSERICGAEINSLDSLQKRAQIQTPPQALHFCISETEDGDILGELLRLYYSDLHVEIHVIKGLQDQDHNRFRIIGLRELARTIGKIIRKSGDPSYVAINATGGYKAQIAVAVLIGQTLGVGVYYKHELFNEIIQFPPMPISFDYELIGQNGGLLSKFENNETLELEESQVDAKLRVLLEEVEVDTKKLWALAPIGQIYLDGFRQRNPIDKSLPPPADGKTKPKFRDDHYPKGFPEYVEKVWLENDFIRSCHSLPYDGQRGIRDREFYVRENDGQIVGEYVDKNNFGARFGISTTAETMAQKTAVVLYLNEKYGTKK